jgi:hypothetical protein
VCASPVFHTCHIPCPSHSSWLDHLNNIWWAVEIIKFLIMHSSPFPWCFVPLRPKYPPQQPILEHPQPTFFCSMRHQVSHPYKTGRIRVLSILIVVFFGSRLADKRFCTKRQDTLPYFSVLLISSWMEFWLIRVVLPYFKCSSFQWLYYPSVLWLCLLGWWDMTVYEYSRTLDCEQLGLRVFYKTSKNFEVILTW